MPIIKSAVKRARQTKVRTTRNKVTKQNMRSALKAVEAAIAAGDSENVRTLQSKAQSAIDTAVKKNLIHKNRAARKKAQLSARVKAVAGSSAKPAAKKATAKPAKKAAAKPAAKKTVAKKTATKKK